MKPRLFSLLLGLVLGTIAYVGAQVTVVPPRLLTTVANTWSELQTFADGIGASSVSAADAVGAGAGDNLFLSSGDGVSGKTSGSNLFLRAGGAENDNGAEWELTGGSPQGTNIAGTDSYIRGSRSTGNALGGRVIFALTGSGASGSDLNGANEPFLVDALGAVFSQTYTAPPAAGDCDDAAETGRVAWDSTNDLLWICSGASGWRKIATAAP